MATDPASELLGQVAAIDESLRSRVIALAHASLDEAEFLIKHGDPKMKAGLVRNFLQVFSKYLSAKEQDEEMQEIRRAVMELREAVVGRRLDADDSGSITDAEQDKPN